MAQFALVPDGGPAQVCGLIARGSQAKALLGKLHRRAGAYASLHFARGSDWIALLSQDPASQPLPWVDGRPLFLHRLTQAAWCQIGFRPNVPQPVLHSVLERLAAQHGLSGSYALTAAPRRIHDLAGAVPLASLAAKALA